MRKIIEYTGHRKVTKDCGVEVEMEISRGDFPSVSGWSIESDGSLRGRAAEYVSVPSSWENILNLTKSLKERLEAYGVKIDPSIRTGVHLHINFQQHTLQEVQNFVALYAIFERALLRFCGENREYNLFARPLLDSEYVIIQLNQAVKHRDLSYLNTDYLRYCAINLRSLIVHGTIELRAMETRPELAGLDDWIHLCKALYESSLKYQDINTILEDFSMSDVHEFATRVFGEKLVGLLKIETYEVIEGMRIAQDICYGEIG